MKWYLSDNYMAPRCFFFVEFKYFGQRESFFRKIILAGLKNRVIAFFFFFIVSAVTKVNLKIWATNRCRPKDDL